MKYVEQRRQVDSIDFLFINFFKLWWVVFYGKAGDINNDETYSKMLNEIELWYFVQNYAVLWSLCT